MENKYKSVNPRVYREYELIIEVIKNRLLGD